MPTRILFFEIWENPKLSETEKILTVVLLLKGEWLSADDVVAKLPDMLSDEHNQLLVNSLLDKYHPAKQSEDSEQSETDENEAISQETTDAVFEETHDLQPATVEQSVSEQDRKETSSDVNEETSGTPASEATKTDTLPTDVGNEVPKPKRGRPKGSKNKPKETASQAPASVPAEKGPTQPLQKSKVQPIGDPPTDTPTLKVSGENKPQRGRPKGSKNKSKTVINGLENPTDEELIEKFKFGNPLEYETLWSYCTGHKKYHYVRTSYQMEGANCVGIFVPYLPIFQVQKACKEFIVGIRKIDYSGMGQTMLSALAQREHSPYLGNEWGTLDRDQFASLQPIKEQLNPLLKKLGGDPIGNDKMNSVARPSFFAKSPTTRYTCSVQNV